MRGRPCRRCVRSEGRERASAVRQDGSAWRAVETSCIDCVGHVVFLGATLRRMDYSDWLWLKLVLFFALAFAWGIYCGVTGRPLGLEESERHTESGRSEAEAPEPEAKRLPLP